MAADGAAAEVPTPAEFAQGGRASRHGAGWVHVELHATSWKCNFCASSFAGSNHTRVRAGAPGVVCSAFLSSTLKKNGVGLGVSMALAKNNVKLRNGISGIFKFHRNCIIEIAILVT